VLRRRKFTRAEQLLVWTLSVLIGAAALAGLGVAAVRGEWRLVLPSVGVLVVGGIYALAAWRGRPLG
jgi:hypothetical protein